MAASIRILLPLICAVLVNAENAFDNPFFNTKPFPLSSKLDEVPRDHNLHKFSEKHSSMANTFSYNSHQNNPFDPFHSYLEGGLDPYFAFPSMGNMGLPLHRPFNPGMNFGMPGINNIFNIPGPNSNGNPKKQEGPNANNNGSDAGKKRTESAAAPEKDPKSTDNVPPKTNLDNDEIAGTDDKQVDLDKKKDFLLMGQGGNGNNMFLLHENIPNGNPAIQPNTQPGNVVYVPYQPGQGNTPLYQVVATPNNVPITSEKQFVNPFSSVVSNLPTTNPVNQNNGYILIYFNGQMIQIPGVVLNPPQNNVQGTNVMMPNTMAVVQNPASNNMYTTVPNQGTNNMYIAQPNQGTNNMYAAQNNQGTNPQYVQMPGQAVTVPGNQQSSQTGYQPNGAANGYYQPTMTGNQGNLPNQPNNQNNQYQPMSAPINSGSGNGYGQSNMMSNQGNNQGAGSRNPTISTYPAVVLPMDTVSNGNQGNAMVNAPSHDTAMNTESRQPSSQPSAPKNNAVTLDHNTMSNYGAIPAVMISGFKDDDGKNKKDSKRDRKVNEHTIKEEVKINPT